MKSGDLSKRILLANGHDEKGKANRYPFAIRVHETRWMISIFRGIWRMYPQSRTFEANEDVLVMFQGPHAYISFSQYSRENVPTWDYQAVRMYGKASIIGKDD